MELCSTEGLIYHTEDGKPVPQLHCTFSNAAGTVIGGHMVEGTIVKLTLEISIAELEEVDLLCKKDPATENMFFLPLSYKQYKCRKSGHPLGCPLFFNP